MRDPKPHWKKSHKCWYLKLNGEFIRLDPDKEVAWQKYHQIMGGQRQPTDDTMFGELLVEFLQHCEANNRPRTTEWYREHLTSFYKTVKSVKAVDIRPFHVERWIRARYPDTRNGNTISNAMRCVQRMMNWAAKTGRISNSPLKSLVKPAATPRDCYLTPDQFEKLLAAVPDDEFKDFVNVMRHTGCRPQEARFVRAEEFKPADRCWVIPKESDGNKSKKEERVVHLDKVAFEITQRRAALVGSGILFRNRKGNAWTTAALKCRCARLRDKLGFDVTPYAIRHTFATEAIIRGVDLITIAKLMGHADLRMLQRVYAKIHKRSDHLRAALKKATGEDAA